MWDIRKEKEEKRMPGGTTRGRRRGKWGDSAKDCKGQSIRSFAKFSFGKGSKHNDNPTMNCLYNGK